MIGLTTPVFVRAEARSHENGNCELPSPISLRDRCHLLSPLLVTHSQRLKRNEVIAQGSAPAGAAVLLVFRASSVFINGAELQFHLTSDPLSKPAVSPRPSLLKSPPLSHTIHSCDFPRETPLLVGRRYYFRADDSKYPFCLVFVLPHIPFLYTNHTKRINCTYTFAARTR